MTTARGVTAAIEVLDRGIGGTGTPPLERCSSPQEKAEAIKITAYVSSKLNNSPECEASLAKRDVVSLETQKAFEEIESFCNEVEAQYEKQEQEFINDVAREIKSMDSKETHTIKRTLNGHPVIIVVGPKAHAHEGTYGCGKMGKESKLGSYAVFGKSSGIKDLIQKIFFGLPKAFAQVQPYKEKVEVPVVAKKEPASKSKKSLLERIFSCFFFCFGKRK
jgi:hypothetical protein